MSGKVVNFLAFQANWFACVLGAAQGLPWLGPLTTVLLAAHYVHAAARRRRALALLGLVLLLGLFVDSSLVLGERLVFSEVTEGPWPPLAPPWILALWVALATTIDSSMSWIQGRLGLAILLGALSGPLAYLAGERLGAVELGRPLWLTLLVLALTWAAALPVVVQLESLLGPSEPAVA